MATTARASEPRSYVLPAAALLIAGAVFVVLLATSGRYGYFRDTLYYLACARHLAWGYVDQPPLIAGLVWLVSHTLGASLAALAVAPALADAGLVLLTAALARELGGGRFAAGLAALAAACVPVYWVQGRQLSMNIFEPLLWMGCLFVVIRIVKTGDQRLWLWFGALAGIGLENKYSIGVFGAGVIAGLLLTGERRAFAQKWLWLGGLIALGIFAPNLIWNIRHHWPFFELMHNIRASGRDVRLGPAAYWLTQILMVSPVNLLLWLPGLAWLFGARQGRFRVLAWTFVFTAGIFMALHGKDYYTAPIYPILLAAGAVAAEAASAARRWIRPALAGLLVLLTAPLLPIVVPFHATPAGYLRFVARLPFPLPRTEVGHASSPLPQFFADELGWRQMTAEVARAYNALPPAARADTAIFAGNYGEAGAIDFFGPRYGLPPAISGHQSYFLWGPRGYTGARMIAMSGDRALWLRLYRRVTQVGMKDVPYALERGPIWLCEDPRGESLQATWRRWKHWD